MRSNVWEIQGAIDALAENPPCVPLARRYLAKALECVRCMYCHGTLSDGRTYRNHFKGYVHEDCLAKYDGRMDYERQHADDRP